MITLNIQVTQDDILNGCKKDANNCPVARAIERAIVNHFKLNLNKDFVAVSVGDGIYFTVISDQHSEYFAPEDSQEVIDFIENFDNEMNVEPFEVAMEFDFRGVE